MRFPHILLVFALVLAFGGCSGNKELDESEGAAINKIFNTGVSQPDPYVRAETFRVIELVGDAKFATYATKGLDDKSPMVRVASLRATLAVAPVEGGKAAGKLFSNGDTAERRAVLRTIADFEMGPSQRELLARALRSDDDVLRREAFEALYMTRIDEAVANKDQKLLESTLFPELGRYIGNDKDPILAALALRKFLDLGQKDRATPLIKTLEDETAPPEKRIAAAKILVGAHAEPALPAFTALVERYDASIADDTLGVPIQLVPAKLLRLAILGTAATGSTQYVGRAREYINNVAEDQAIEVLEALGPNKSPDAALTIKVAMQDARRPVRLRAIELYEARPDATASALLKALEEVEYETQKRITLVLRERFREEWITSLTSRVQQISKMESTLELMRDVVTTQEEADDLIAPMKGVFEKLVESEEGRRAALASYFIAITTPGEAGSKIASEKLDDPTRYAYLEFLVRTAPQAHVDTFRQFLYDDLFVIRLMASAGLWRVLGTQ